MDVSKNQYRSTGGQPQKSHGNTVWAKMGTHPANCLELPRPSLQKCQILPQYTTLHFYDYVNYSYVFILYYHFNNEYKQEKKYFKVFSFLEILNGLFLLKSNIWQCQTLLLGKTRQGLNNIFMSKILHV